jgi:hypothetical protein
VAVSLVAISQLDCIVFSRHSEVLNHFSELYQSLFLIQSNGKSSGTASGRQGKNKNQDGTEPVEDSDQKIHLSFCTFQSWLSAPKPTKYPEKSPIAPSIGPLQKLVEAQKPKHLQRASPGSAKTTMISDTIRKKRQGTHQAIRILQNIHNACQNSSSSNEVLEL